MVGSLTLTLICWLPLSCVSAGRGMEGTDGMVLLVGAWGLPLDWLVGKAGEGSSLGSTPLSLLWSTWASSVSLSVTLTLMYKTWEVLDCRYFWVPEGTFGYLMVLLGTCVGFNLNQVML